jgi:hypothetical protein
MATAALISVNEYLSSTCRPDQEMLEGRLVERNAGEYDHSNLQGALITRLRQRQRPVKRRAYVCSKGDFREPKGEVLEIPLSPICIPLLELLAALD